MSLEHHEKHHKPKFTHNGSDPGAELPKPMKPYGSGVSTLTRKSSRLFAVLLGGKLNPKVVFVFASCRSLSVTPD